MVVAVPVETKYNGYLKVESHVVLDNGLTYTRELVRRGNVVAAFLYDSILNRVVLVEQFRVGAYAAGMEGMQLEPVAGFIDKGESPLEAIKREVLEETGLIVDKFTLMTEYVVSPGYSDETCAMFFANVDSTKAKDMGGLESENENIRVRCLPFAEFSKMFADGKVRNSMLLIATFWFINTYLMGRTKNGVES